MSSEIATHVSVYEYGCRARLRVKIKSLAEEAKIIRHEERRIGTTRFPQMYQDSVRGCLRHHRVTRVRDEARAAQLAYAIMRGVPYVKVEGVAAKAVPISRIASILKSMAWYDDSGKDINICRWIAFVPTAAGHLDSPDATGQSATTVGEITPTVA